MDQSLPLSRGLLEWLVRMFSGVHSGPWVGFSTLPLACAPGLGFQGLGSLHLPSLSVQSITHSDLLCGLGCTSRGWKRRGEVIRLTFAPRGPSLDGRWPHMEQFQQCWQPERVSLILAGFVLEA